MFVEYYHGDFAEHESMFQSDYPTPPSFYCNTNKDCAPSQVCSHPPGGPGICQDSKAMACISNNDCSPGETCVLLSNLQTACQITVGGNVPGSGNRIQVGGIGLSCKRDSDCANQERCVDYYGKWQCMVQFQQLEEMWARWQAQRSSATGSIQILPNIKVK
ncbi:hypothetical protein NECAME_12796 [Necator americanus]|uniref:Uncharacterized protein n=1 Tax=Necator americanus TaxID=51031 RepID=W2T152_NECAM|nr:hypothetical protein NECAME_12796 [Necator americanus]ETN74707.1 hypothetical protein NECAME_12796 [Necator americanus]